MERYTHGIFGSSDVQASVANAEILPSPPAEWNFPYPFYKFKFYNLADCHIIINGGQPIFIPAYTNFFTEDGDKIITSFKIQESGVNFTWVGYC